MNAPRLYGEWLSTLELMKSAGADGSVFEAAARGSFSGSDAMKAALCSRITETVNYLLNAAVGRFAVKLNEFLSLGDGSEAYALFRRLGRDVERAAFFRGLSFLSEDFRAELEKHAAEQMGEFRSRLIKELKTKASEAPNGVFEDMLYMARKTSFF